MISIKYPYSDWGFVMIGSRSLLLVRDSCVRMFVCVLAVSQCVCVCVCVCVYVVGKGELLMSWFIYQLSDDRNLYTYG